MLNDGSVGCTGKITVCGNTEAGDCWRGPAVSWWVLTPGAERWGQQKWTASVKGCSQALAMFNTRESWDGVGRHRSEGRCPGNEETYSARLSPGHAMGTVQEPASSLWLPKLHPLHCHLPVNISALFLHFHIILLRYSGPGRIIWMTSPCHRPIPPLPGTGKGTLPSLGSIRRGWGLCFPPWLRLTIDPK